MMNIQERFLKYVNIPTQSAEGVSHVPTTEVQWNLARELEKEMNEMGLSDVRVSENAYVYGVLPATPGYEELSGIGFIAHMDTATEFPGEGLKTQIIENYDGGEVKLGTSGRVLDLENFPHLPSLKGKTLITTDGTTLLGADDKAGIAEILTAVSMLQEQNIPHGKVCIGFTPDEEVGLGPSHFDIENFGAEYAYTMDGGDPACVSYENFHACAATFEIKGYSIHPGSSKNRMINAALVGCEINGMLPTGETPRDSEGREGFYHLTSFNGSTTSCTLSYIVRDFDMGYFRARKATLEHIAVLMNEKYGEGTVTLTIRDQYPNMYEVLKDKMFIVDNAYTALRTLGLEPYAQPARGGTDGATLSYHGLPCPNLGTGGFAAHGPFEHVTVEDMQTCAQLIVEIVKLHSAKKA